MKYVRQCLLRAELNYRNKSKQYETVRLATGLWETHCLVRHIHFRKSFQEGGGEATLARYFDIKEAIAKVPNV